MWMVWQMNCDKGKEAKSMIRLHFLLTYLKSREKLIAEMAENMRLMQEEMRRMQDELERVKAQAAKESGWFDQVTV